MQPRNDDTELLRQRLRAGLWLILACVALFALGDADVHRASLGRLYTVKATHVTLLVALLVALGRVSSWRGCIVCALVAVNGTFACIAATDVISGHTETTPLLPVVASMGAAALLPWGLRPQLFTAAFMAAGDLWVLGLSGRPLVELADPATSTIASVGVSVYVAYEFDRYRRDRRGTEAVLGQRARLEALRADVRLAAAEDMGLSEKLQACVYAIVHHLDAAAAQVWTLDESGTHLELRAEAGDLSHDGPRRLPLGATGIARVAVDRRACLLPPAPEMRRDGIAAVACHPAYAGESLIGVVTLCAREELDDRVLDPLAAVAYAVATSVERHESAAALERSQADLEEEAAVSAALASVAEEMFSSLDAPVILDRLCQLAARLLGADYGATLLWRAEGDLYAPVAFHGFTDAERAIVERTCPPRESVTAMFADGDHVVEFSTAPGLGRHICLALRRSKDLVGVQLTGWRDDAGTLTPRRRRIARGIARVASMALANAHLVEELARVSRLKSEFVSTMSHELRTPLNVILGYAEMARDPDVGTERDRHLDRIETAGRELLELIESTLQIGRIEAGRVDVQLEPVALAPFWAELRKTCASLPRAAGVALRWDDADDAAVITDPRKLAIVVRNLVGNACKFTEQGHITVVLTREPDGVVARVTDTGIGIRREDQEAIFEMFRQADGSDSRRFGGTGLGLYIVRRFVAALGGSVTLESAPGCGATFTVRVPCGPAPARAVDAA